MTLDDIKDFPKNVIEARFILKEAFKIDSTPSIDGLPEEYKNDVEALNKLRRLLNAMHLYAVHHVYFKDAGKAHSEFYLRENRAKVVFDTSHLSDKDTDTTFFISLDELFG